MTTILIADNGSSKPEATLQLRGLAQSLSEQVKRPIYPVSLQHADRIPSEQLNGQPASTFKDFMAQQLATGERKFVLLPLFFGASRAIASFVPEQVTLLKQQFPAFELTIAEVVYPLPQGERLLESIVLDHLLQTLNKSNEPVQHAVLVDHGSPIAKVTQVRKQIAAQLQSQLPSTVQLSQAVMERRAGKEYDFNGDLLEHWLTEKAESGVNEVAVVLLFFLAGRHAGASGDIADICLSVMEKYSHFHVSISPLIAEHRALIALLKQRLNKALEKTE